MFLHLFLLHLNCYTILCVKQSAFIKIASEMVSSPVHHQPSSSKSSSKSIFPLITPEIPNQGRLFTCSRAICYDNLGCFEPWPLSIAYGLYRISVCPYPPEQIRPNYYVFRSNSPNVTINWKEINSKDRIVVFLHGYKNFYHDSRFLRLKNRLLDKTSVDVVIMVDYNRGSDPKIYSQTGLYNFYQASVNGQVVGRELANFVDDLRRVNRVKPDKIHFIGYSLGSHVIHFAAEFAKQEYSIRFGRITCLDPPGVLIFSEGKRIHKSDAHFVDVIHTTQFSIGIMDLLGGTQGRVGLAVDLGHIDFYPNGGGEDGDQPGCSGIEWCSHNFALLLLEASIEGCQFIALKCPSWESYVNSKNLNCLSSDGTLGYYSDQYRARGRHYLVTSSNPMQEC